MLQSRREIFYASLKTIELIINKPEIMEIRKVCVEIYQSAKNYEDVKFNLTFYVKLDEFHEEF